VHRSRVATRRLRSTLRTFAGVLPDHSSASLREELRWHAEKLGAARDAEVLRERLLAALADLPRPAGEPVTRRIATALADAHAVAHAALVSSMQSQRYEQLHDALERFLAEPPLEWVAAEPAAVLLPPMLGRVARRVRKLARRAAARPADLARWHEVRKAAKAARYGAEVLVPALGEVADGWRSRWEAVTEGFGAVQDCVVAMAVVDDLAARAVAEGLPVRAAQEDALREALLRGRAALVTALAEADPGAVG
jgi:CHAD domain-containing protein